MPKDKKSKLGGIKSTTSSEKLKKAGAVSDVEKVQKAGSVSKVKATGKVAKHKAVRALTSADRDTLRTLIDEEANNMLGGTDLSQEQQEIVIKAVKMAVDAAIIDDDESEGS